MACGKSFVADALREHGCHVIEADEVGHQVLRPDGEAYGQVIEAFGPGILDENGAIDRSRLAGMVFSNAARLEQLNSIVHPAVRKRGLKEFEEIRRRDPHSVVVYVAAILIESGAWREMDKIIVVSCDRAQQFARAMHRTGAVESAVLARLENQMPLEKKRTFADYIIDTSGTKEDTLRQTALVYEELRRLAA